MGILVNQSCSSINYLRLHELVFINLLPLQFQSQVIIAGLPMPKAQANQISGLQRISLL